MDGPACLCTSLWDRRLLVHTELWYYVGTWMQNLPLQFPVPQVGISLFPIGWGTMLYYLSSAFNKEKTMWYFKVRVLLASMHRKVSMSLLWSSKSQPILGTREPGTRRTPRTAMPSLMGTIPQALSMVGRDRASNCAHWQPWHGKQQAGAEVLSEATGDTSGNGHRHGVFWDRV